MTNVSKDPNNRSLDGEAMSEGCQNTVVTASVELTPTGD